MSGAPLRIEECTHLGTWAGEWDALVDSSPLPSPFLRSWWLEATCRARPLFLLALDGDALAGGIALQRKAFPGLDHFGFMGAGPLAPDHLDLLAARGREADVAQALHRWLSRRRAVVDLRGAAESAAVATALGAGTRRGVEELAPYTPLPHTFAEYMAARPAQLRNTLHRAEARLAREGAVHRQPGVAGADAALAALLHLHRMRWGEASAFARSFAGFARAARAGMARGELLIHEVASDGEVVASVAMFHVAGRASYYQGGRLPEHRWRGAGTVALARAVEHACAVGCSELDLLRGDEPYKRMWIGHTREVARLQWATTPAAAAALRTTVAARSLRRAAAGAVKAARRHR